MGNQLFINPYNFIPFGSTIEERRKSREAAYRGRDHLVSGWLTVELNTKTPLIIPDGAHPAYWDVKSSRYVRNPDEDAKKILHKEYCFLRIPGEAGKEPVIPGSELRGMIRSVYETVTDSCTAFLLDDKPISQRVPTFGSLQRRGLLAYEETGDGTAERRWVLYSTFAEKVTVKVNGTTFRDENGRTITGRNGDFVTSRGWLQYNIPVNTKKPYHIAYLKENEKIYTWDFAREDGTPDKEKNDEPYKTLRSALQDRPQGLKNSNAIPNKNLMDALERAKKGDNNKVPVYYFMVKRGDETLVYLSNSSIGRIAQKRKWREIIGVHAPCESTDRLCPACLLFGTTNGEGLKGHIRVTDAVPAGKYTSETHTLQILGEPRTSAFEFYLRKPEGGQVTYWNFDFYGEKVKVQNGRTHTQYHDLAEATPRGRKMYWHSPVAPDAARDKMNATMEAINGTFEFRVYFDKITEEQLRDLIWVITLGENRRDSTKQHKLGHAKPLGYGSVKLIVKKETIRAMSVKDGDIEVEMKEAEYGDIKADQGQDLDAEAVRNLLIMCDTRSVPDNIPVMYPKELDNKGRESIYSWFAKNRENAGRLQTLPEPSAQNLALKGSWGTQDARPANPQRNTQSSYDVKKTHQIVGNIKFFNSDQNFGIIAGEDGIDYRIKINPYNPGIRAEDLKAGCKVTFVPKKLSGKWIANQCRLEK